MNTPLRIGLLSAAHVHAPSYARALTCLPDARLAAVWDDDAARGAELARRHDVRFEGDLAALLARPDLDAVIITAENVRHRPLCEAAYAAGVVLATAFPMRHNAPVRAVKEAIARGDLGTIRAVRATNHGTLPPGWFLNPALSGGGAVMDHTVHVIDILRWYLEDEPVEVYAEISHGLHGAPVE
ncbi:MAG: Gfo/Idh/MocA family oxidoreductase, partial [Chloroflexi bacterium]|nr:Gfo/Idh/MocA family oxidoreductase [Chloroflexota bacterium]